MLHANFQPFWLSKICNFGRLKLQNSEKTFFLNTSKMVGFREKVYFIRFLFFARFMGGQWTDVLPKNAPFQRYGKIAITIT